jgi:hypothetical protein
MLARSKTAARRTAIARRVRRCRGRRAAGLTPLHIAVNLQALALVMVDAELLAYDDRENRAKIISALENYIADWHG